MNALLEERNRFHMNYDLRGDDRFQSFQKEQKNWWKEQERKMESEWQKRMRKWDRQMEKWMRETNQEMKKWAQREAKTSLGQIKPFPESTIPPLPPLNQYLAPSYQTYQIKNTDVPSDHKTTKSAPRAEKLLLNPSMIFWCTALVLYLAMLVIIWIHPSWDKK